MYYNTMLKKTFLECQVMWEKQNKTKELCHVIMQGKWTTPMCLLRQEILWHISSALLFLLSSFMLAITIEKKYVHEKNVAILFFLTNLVKFYVFVLLFI